MDTLPLEIILVIFDCILKITDKRKFTQTCKTYNNITKILIEKIKLKKNIHKYFFIGCDVYNVEKFTFELFHDYYLDSIPLKYVNSKNKIIVDVAIMSGNIKLLKLANDNGCDCFRDNYYISMAVVCGHLDVLIFCIRHGGVWIPKFNLDAVIYNRLNILIWTHENNFTFYMQGVYDNAINYGKLDILKWTVDNGAILNFNGNSCYIAVEEGHLDILIWLNSKGCGINKELYLLAQKKGYNDIVSWLENNKFICS